MSNQRFAFGRNWKSFLASLDQERIEVATDSLRQLFGVDDLHGRRFLDLGCGSGILAIAAARMGASPAVALEFDPAAMAVARENAVRHQVDDALEFVEGDAVEWVSEDSRGTTYPIIAANLFSELLIAILPHLPKWLPPGGTVILSGFLTSQAKDVNDAAVKAGITLDRFVRRGKWVAAAGNLA